MKCIIVAPLSFALLIAACAIDDPERPYGRDAGASGTGAGGSGGARDGAAESGRDGAFPEVPDATTTPADDGPQDAAAESGGGEADAAAESAVLSPDAGPDALDASMRAEVDGEAAADAAADGTLADASIDGPPDAALVDAAVERDATACANNAIRFNQGSTSYAQIPRPVADDFTIEAWIRTSTSSGGMQFHEGLGLIYADVGGTNNDFGISMLNQRIAIGIGNPDTTYASVREVSNNQWRHVAVTRQRSSGTVQIYVEGTFDASGIPLNTGSLSAAGMLTIGGNTVNGRYYTGEIDELRFWSVIRTPEQIQANLHRRLVGNEAGLVGYYRFDQASGTTVEDMTNGPTSRNATIVGSAFNFVPSAAPIYCD